MRITRIFQDIPLSIGHTVTLDKNASNHVLQVLRLSANDNLILFNGQGGEYQAAISSVSRRSVQATVTHFFPVEKESPLRIHLLQGVSRGNRMDFTIQKAVELGVHAITPLITERCGVYLPPERWEKRLQHWQGIIIHACEQCGRNTIPSLHPAIAFTSWITQEPAETRYILDPTASDTLPSAQPSEPIALLIGPEGGFTSEEIDAATQQNFLPIHLGPRVLRTETAGMTAIAILQSKYGDL